MVSTRSNYIKYNQLRILWGDPYSRITIEQGFRIGDNSLSFFEVNRDSEKRIGNKGPLSRGPLNEKELKKIRLEQNNSASNPWITEITSPPLSYKNFQSAIERLQKEKPSRPWGIIWPDLAVQVTKNEEGDTVLLRHPQDPKIDYPRNFPLYLFEYHPQRQPCPDSWDFDY